jgi:hypothetical protein
VILIAVAVVYLLTRDTGKSKNTAATTPVPTTATTVAPTFLPGAEGGAPTTVAGPTPTTVVPFAPTPPTTAAPAQATTAPPATTATRTGRTVDPSTQMAFAYSNADCTADGGLTVFGSITNNSPGTYSFSYTITMVRADGSVQGTASGSVAHLPPGGRLGPGAIGTGRCSYPLSQGPAPSHQITSITPG